MIMEFTGVYAVALSPFKPVFNFDIEATIEQLDYLIDNGTKGVCILGVTGEYQGVSNEEHQFVRASMQE